MSNEHFPSNNYEGVRSEDGGRSWAAHVEIRDWVSEDIPTALCTKIIHIPACGSDAEAAQRRAM